MTTPRLALGALLLAPLLAFAAGCGRAADTAPDLAGDAPGPVDPASGLPATVHTLAIGDAVRSTWIEGSGGRATERPLARGPAATVIWFSSCSCKCVAECEDRIHALLARYEGKNVRFLAINSNPHDTREDIAEFRARLRSPYEIDRDVNGFTMRTLGIRASASVAVLDGEGRLRYRGAIDDDLSAPTKSYVHAAVDAVLSGSPVEPTEVTSYGCMYPRPEE